MSANRVYLSGIDGKTIAESRYDSDVNICVMTFTDGTFLYLEAPADDDEFVINDCASYPDTLIASVFDESIASVVLGNRLNAVRADAEREHQERHQRVIESAKRQIRHYKKFYSELFAEVAKEE